MTNNSRKYDLIDRTGKFGEVIISFCQSLLTNPINRILVSQLVRSGTSIGANYMEADAAESRKDFEHKIGIAKKEAKETLHWLKMIDQANPDKQDDIKKLQQEAHELVLIFSSIINNSKKKER